MGLDEEVEILRKVPLFADIDPARLKLLCFASERVTFADGHVLFREGEAGDSAYIILGGQAEVVVETPHGPTTVATVEKNNIVGEVAILCDVPRTATVRAVGEVVTLKITKELFFRMATEFPEFAVKIMRELAHRLERTTAQLAAR